VWESDCEIVGVLERQAKRTLEAQSSVSRQMYAFSTKTAPLLPQL
jgi:hypothetical protein